MSEQEYIGILKRLQGITAKVKAELFMLFKATRDIAIRVIRFLQRHAHLGRCLILGAIMAFLLSFIPWVGGLLALVALVTCAAVGVMNELRSELELTFA